MRTNKIIAMLFILLASHWTNAQNLKVTCLADFNHHETGHICKKNVEKLLQAFDSCATFHLSETLLYTDSVNEGSLLKEISDNLPAIPSDVSVFYFSGIYKKGENHYPLIQVGDKWTNTKSIYELIQNKTGLNLIIIDGIPEQCNSKLVLDSAKFSLNTDLDSLLAGSTGSIYITGTPADCTFIINNRNSLLTALIANKFAQEGEGVQLNWKSFLRKVEDVQQDIAVTNNLVAPEIYWKLNIKNRKEKILPYTPEPDSVNSVVTFDDIPVGEKVLSELGDTIVSIIQKPDSVICKQIITKIDSTGGKGKEFTYTVPETVGDVAPDLHAILRFIVLADETYTSNIEIKHQFEPVLSFSFYRGNNTALLLYSPSSQSFGFRYKNSLIRLTYQNTGHTEKIFNNIIEHIHHE
ncbi:MAG: hypothetical protein AB2L20_12390 [Mangrovibacterium sp.]